MRAIKAATSLTTRTSCGTGILDPTTFFAAGGHCQLSRLSSVQYSKASLSFVSTQLKAAIQMSRHNPGLTSHIGPTYYNNSSRLKSPEPSPRVNPATGLTEQEAKLVAFAEEEIEKEMDQMLLEKLQRELNLEEARY